MAAPRAVADGGDRVNGAPGSGRSSRCSLFGCFTGEEAFSPPALPHARIDAIDVDPACIARARIAAALLREGAAAAMRDGGRDARGPREQLRMTIGPGHGGGLVEVRPGKPRAEANGPAGMTQARPLHWFDVAGQAIVGFAGVWRRLEGGGAVFAFLTCDPNPLFARIHPKAMPVMLHEEDEARWLECAYEDAIALAQPFPSQLMRVDAEPEPEAA